MPRQLLNDLETSEQGGIAETLTLDLSVLAPAGRGTLITDADGAKVVFA